MKQPVSSRQRLVQFRTTWGKKKPDKIGDGASADEKKKPDKAKRRAFLRQYIVWLKPFRWKLLVVFLLALTAATLDMVWPWAIKVIIDQILLKTHDRASA